MRPAPDWMAPAAAVAAALAALLPAGWVGAWLAFEVIGHAYGLETLAGLSACVLLVLVAAASAWEAGRAVSSRTGARP